MIYGLPDSFTYSSNSGDTSGSLKITAANQFPKKRLPCRSKNKKGIPHPQHAPDSLPSFLALLFSIKRFKIAAMLMNYNLFAKPSGRFDENAFPAITVVGSHIHMHNVTAGKGSQKAQPGDSRPKQLAQSAALHHRTDITQIHFLIQSGLIIIIHHAGNAAVHFSGRADHQHLYHGFFPKFSEALNVFHPENNDGVILQWQNTALRHRSPSS